MKQSSIKELATSEACNVALLRYLPALQLPRQDHLAAHHLDPGQPETGGETTGHTDTASPSGGVRSKTTKYNVVDMPEEGLDPALLPPVLGSWHHAHGAT